ncbi:DUF346 domain-containing protein, partial [Salinispora arenicola]
MYYRLSGHLIKRLAVGLALPLALITGPGAVSPASAAPSPAVPGDPALPAYPGLPTTSDQAGPAAVTTTAVPCDNNGADKNLTRGEVLTRAQSWLSIGIPYSQERCYRNTYGDYRTDCSGFVSMAWGLGGSGSAFWTGNLMSRASAISRSSLKPGDALLRHTGDPSENHVALFLKWADSAETQPVVIEQTGSRNTVQNTWSSSYAALYSPVRYDNILDVSEGGDRSYYNGSQDHHYERGADNTLVHWWYTDKWNQAILPGTITSDPVAYYANGQDHVYGRNASGGLQHWWYAGGQWNTANLGGAITGAPTAFYANGQDHAFARTTEGTLYHWWYVSGSGWQKADLGGAITGSPTGYAGGNQQHVYARTTAGTLYHWWYVPGSGWQKADLGGAITNSPSGYRADNGQDHVYARTTAGTLYHWW